MFFFFISLFIFTKAAANLAIFGIKNCEILEGLVLTICVSGTFQNFY